ncbi:MAG: cupin domain-containing protein [Intrasporangium sp.]|uniref:cupin domain-containing protein n=1 Tax=Intrasporangium sp. TaxID=1925024 RepID=UPI003F809C3F
MPELIAAPTRIPVAGGKIIEEHVGAVTTPDLDLASSVSVAHMVAPGGWSEPAQTPDFDEITVVLRGQVLVEHDGGVLTVEAGQTAISRRGERVRYSCGDEGAEYVSVCLPAFTNESVNREDEA